MSTQQNALVRDTAKQHSEMAAHVVKIERDHLAQVKSMREGLLGHE